jgi:hypothetical protein
LRFQTIIEAATQTGKVEIVNYSREHDARYDICTAAMLGNLNDVQEFLKKDPSLISASGAHGIPLLYFPVIRAHQEIADFLFGQGAEPNASSPDGIIPL